MLSCCMRGRASDPIQPSSANSRGLSTTVTYIHESALPHLAPPLRIFEGCARGYIGRIEGANLIKLSRREPKVSYLSYPDFENDPHPALAGSVTVHFQTFKVRFHDYRDRRNPFILHRKETFLHSQIRYTPNLQD